MTPLQNPFEPFDRRLRADGQPDIAIRAFAQCYAMLRAGGTGYLADADIEPARDVPDVEGLPDALSAVGREALGHTVVIKLNGGLGTTMGLRKAKSLLPVRGGRSFLEIIAEACRVQQVPLLLMNSFATRDDSLAALAPFPRLCDHLPPDFVQHRAPKVDRETLAPVRWSSDPDLEWCPPGHGDLYVCLRSTGLLDRLLESGFKVAFVSNADNLGAVVDEKILGYIHKHEIPFLMEVADRTRADRKGGHLARLPGGGLVLREAAQCPPDEEALFQDIGRHRYFNTNSLWLHLPTLKRVLVERSGLLGLPVIVNRKTVDPRDPDSTPVYQLETAMGAAIGVIPGARALRVPRARFAPVKSTSDLLAVSSDAYVLTDDFRILRNPARAPERPSLDVVLDNAWYGHLDQLQERFPHGPPSLLACDRFEVTGNIVFGRNVTLKGTVRLFHDAGPSDDPRRIPDGSVLEGE